MRHAPFVPGPFLEVPYPKAPALKLHFLVTRRVSEEEPLLRRRLANASGYQNLGKTHLAQIQRFELRLVAGREPLRRHSRRLLSAGYCTAMVRIMRARTFPVGEKVQPCVAHVF